MMVKVISLIHINPLQAAIKMERGDGRLGSKNAVFDHLRFYKRKFFRSSYICL